MEIDYVKALRDWSTNESLEPPIDEVHGVLDAYDLMTKARDLYKSDFDKAAKELRETHTALDSERAANAGLREAIARSMRNWRKLKELEPNERVKGHFRELENQCLEVLATDAGKPFLDRLREAERLLRQTPWLQENVPLRDFAAWIDSRNALLCPPTTETKGEK